MKLAAGGGCIDGLEAKNQGNADTDGNTATNGAGKNKGKSSSTKNVGEKLNKADMDKISGAVDRAVVKLNKFVNTLLKGEGPEYEQIAADYGFSRSQLAEFSDTAEFLIIQARSVADLLVQYKHGESFIYSSASHGDAYTPGKIAISKQGFNADTLVHEGAHKVFSHDHGVDGLGNSAPVSRHSLDVGSAGESLKSISSYAQKYSISASDRAYNRGWLKMSAYRFEYSVASAARRAR